MVRLLLHCGRQLFMTSLRLLQPTISRKTLDVTLRFERLGIFSCRTLDNFQDSIIVRDQNALIR